MTDTGNSLNRTHWIAAGLATLRDRGYAALSVNGLARALNVTKGSFYYHFQDREDFETALLENYIETMTDGTGQQIAVADHPAERLRQTLELHINSAPGYTLAFRAWGMINPKVAEALTAMDRFRLRRATGMFRELGFSQLASETRARVLVTFLHGEAGLFNRINDAQRMAQLDERLSLFMAGATSGDSDQEHHQHAGEGE